MHLHFERTSSSRTDCTVLSLTWMGKVPDELPEEVHGWKLNRVNYYQDGWLATGNTRGIVGVTFTTCHCRKTADLPHRTNYNLRGHRSEVTLVKWNEPYQKLASCDSSGIIFVWIKYEGRWSIELINDRNTQVTDFSWSHDGRMALICYLDGFVLVGSVAGQRYWSSMLNLEATITCGIWTPDDQQVFFGTSNGQVLVIDVHGAMVAQVSVLEDVTICAMAWSCEKFKMEETDEDEGMTPTRQPKESKPSVLAVCFQNGAIYLMKNYDDVSPVVVDTGLRGIQMEWSNNGELLAVAGVSADSKPSFFENFVHFYTETGVLRFVIPLACSESPVTALTWGHNDKRLFVATGCVIHIGWVTRRVASLQLLSRLAIHRCLQDETHVQRLPLPRRLRGLITNLFGQTIRCCLPDPQHLREFVSSPPANNIRLHCTMIRHDDDVVTGSATYTLYLEYLGGLVPLLKGKRASKIRPEFVIFDPQYPECGERLKILKPVTMHSQSSSPIVYSHSYTGSPIPPPRSPVFPETSSDSEVEEGCASPRMQRRRRNRRQAQRDLENGGVIRKELVYLDELPEHEKLVSITSNIWGTKFKLLGLVPWLPAHLGAITYRTSLLHLQPRQMTLVIKELRGPQAPECHGHGLSHGSIASSSSGLISSDDDDDFFEPNLTNSEECAPVAPMTPRKHLRCSGQACAAHHTQPPTVNNTDIERVQTHSSNDYVNFIPNEEFLTIETAGGDKVPIVSFDNGGATRPEMDSSLTSVATQTSFHSIAELHQNTRRAIANEGLSPGCEHCKCCCRDAHRVKLEDSGASKSEMVTPGMSAASSEDQLVTDATHQSDSLASDVQIMVNGVDQASSESFEDDPRSSISLDLRPVCSGIDSSSEGSVFATAEETSLRTKLEEDMIEEGDKSMDISLEDGRSQETELSLSRANAYNGASRLTALQNDLDTINRKVWHKGKHSLPAVQSPGLYPTCGSPPVWGETLQVANKNGDSEMVATSVHVQSNISGISNNLNGVGDLPRWADKAGDLKFIDEDGDDTAPEIMVMGCPQYSAGSSVVFCSNRSKSIGHMQTTEFMNVRDMRQGMSTKDTHRRLTLKGRQQSDAARCRVSGITTERKQPHLSNASDERCASRCGSVGSDDPSCFCDMDADSSAAVVSHSLTSLNRGESKKTCRPREEPFSSCPNITVDNNKVSSPIRRTDRLYVESPLISRSANSSPCGRDQRDSLGEGLDIPLPIQLKTHRGSLPHTENLLDGSGPSSPTSRSIPSSPVVQRKRQQQRKGLLYSPLLLRKVMRQRLVESSDEEGVQSGEDVHMEDFKDLESFQKAYIRKKMKKRRGRVQPDNLETSHPAPASYRELILHNKAPLWNEVSQVYQLDFGGRVTQESAKNFQIEFRGKQVMQFGRIDGNAYTLDFQYPFCALQAFAVALANVTQRLK